jgi:hypothetical protein
MDPKEIARGISIRFRAENIKSILQAALERGYEFSAKDQETMLAWCRLEKIDEEAMLAKLNAFADWCDSNPDIGD